MDASCPVGVVDLTSLDAVVCWWPIVLSIPELNIDDFTWTGEEWEEYCQFLISSRYPDYQRVPDEHGGDFGIDGYSRSAGQVFQCYCPESFHDPKKVYEGARAKMRCDTRKFIDNRQDIEDLLQFRVQKWTLLTPKSTSAKLLQYASSRRQMIVAADLPYVDPNEFTVTIEELSTYWQEHLVLQRKLIDKLPIHLADVDAPLIADFFNAEGAFVDKIRGKLTVVTRDESQVSGWTIEMVGEHLSVRNYMEQMSARYPTIAEDIERIQRTRQHQTRLQCRYTPSRGEVFFDEAVKNLQDDLSSQVKALSGTPDGEVFRLAYGFVGAWLGECSMYFRRNEHGTT